MWNKIFILSLSACMALTAMAQDQPVGIRVDASEYEVNDEEQYTIFSYLDESGVYGYYLSLAHNDDKLTFFTEGTSTSIGVVDEVCMWLGADREAAFAMMDTLLALFDREEGTTVNFAGRAVSGGERLGVQADINCGKEEAPRRQAIMVLFRRRRPSSRRGVPLQDGREAAALGFEDGPQAAPQQKIT